MKQAPRVLIVGGGISGLSAAFWLLRAGIDVEVLEASSNAGGTMKTIHDRGWLVETGPNSALETTPLFDVMCNELGILPEKLYADPASENRFIVRGGTLHVLPMKPGRFVRSKLWTTRGKLRLLKEPFVGRADREESVAAFVQRRLGREFLDFAINPFVAGVYAGDPEQLSVRSAFPKLFALERDYGGLVRGMIGGARARKRRLEKAKDRATMFSFAEGMQTFPDALARYLGPAFHSNTEVRSLSVQRDQSQGCSFTASSLSADAMREHTSSAVILSVPAGAGATLIDSISPSMATGLRSIYYPPVAQVFLGYESPAITRSLDGFGYLVPAVERRAILGTIWSSSLFPHRSPEGHVALTSFVGGARQPELVDRTDAELIEMTHKEICSLLGATAGPVYSRVIRWAQAIPQYNMGHEGIMHALDGVERENPGLFFCANFRGGIAVGDCVMSGERIAGRVVEYLAKERR